MTGPQALRYATWLYAVGLAVHTADHVRRGADVLTTEVKVLGALSTIGGVVVIGLVFGGYRLAPRVAAWFGFIVAFGVARTHFLPKWSDFSDAFPGSHDTGVTAVSWVVTIIEVAGLLALGVAGVYALREQRRLAVRSST